MLELATGTGAHADTPVAMIVLQVLSQNTGQRSSRLAL